MWARYKEEEEGLLRNMDDCTVFQTGKLDLQICSWPR